MLTAAGNVSIWAVHGTSGRWHTQGATPAETRTSSRRTHNMESVLNFFPRNFPPQAYDSPPMTRSSSRRAPRLASSGFGSQPRVRHRARFDNDAQQVIPTTQGQGGVTASREAGRHSLGQTPEAASAIILGNQAVPSFRLVATVDPGNEAQRQFIKSMFLNKPRGELLVITVKENRNLDGQRSSVYMQLRTLKLGHLLRETQGMTRHATSQTEDTRAWETPHLTPDHSPGSMASTPGAPPMATPDGYMITRIPSVQTAPLLTRHPESHISQQGWCEFDDCRQMFVTLSHRPKPGTAPPSRGSATASTSRVHAVPEERYLRVWTLHDYKPIVTLSCDSGVFKPGGDEFDDIKLADRTLLVVTKRAAEATAIAVHVFSLETGLHVRRLTLPLVSLMAIQSLECMADRIVLKQYKQPAKFYDMSSGMLTASFNTHNGNRASPSFVFLSAHQLLLIYMNRRVRTVSLNGKVVANMDVLHCRHGVNCNTTNVFVAEDQRTVYGYCCCTLHAVYSLSVVCVVTGKRIREWSSENQSLPPPVRHALRDVTSLYVHQHANLLLTGHADGTVNSWVPMELR